MATSPLALLDVVNLGLVGSLMLTTFVRWIVRCAAMSADGAAFRQVGESIFHQVIESNHLCTVGWYSFVVDEEALEAVENCGVPIRTVIECCGVEVYGGTFGDVPFWFTHHILVHPDWADHVVVAIAKSKGSVRGWRHPRPAVADPTFQKAADHLERGS